MQIEILALRHQLAVLQRTNKRASLRTVDRLLWVILSRVWAQVIVNLTSLKKQNHQLLQMKYLLWIIASEETKPCIPFISL
jgi:hypothetical protein